MHYCPILELISMGFVTLGSTIISWILNNISYRFWPKICHSLWCCSFLKTERHSPYFNSIAICNYTKHVHFFNSVKSKFDDEEKFVAGSLDWTITKVNCL